MTRSMASLRLCVRVPAGGSIGQWIALHELWANRSDLALFEVEQALWFEAVGSQRVLGRAWEKGIGSQRFG